MELMSFTKVYLSFISYADNYPLTLRYRPPIWLFLKLRKKAFAVHGVKSNKRKPNTVNNNNGDKQSFCITLFHKDRVHLMVKTVISVTPAQLTGTPVTFPNLLESIKHKSWMAVSLRYFHNLSWWVHNTLLSTSSNIMTVMFFK